MAWGSLLIGDDYDAETDEPNVNKAWVVKQLMQHPMLREGGSVGILRTPPPTIPSIVEGGKGLGLADDNFFQTRFGKSANSLVKGLRQKRRIHKEYSDEIVDAISLIRMM